MDHSNHGSTDNAHEMMTPYFHFSGGDFLYFKAWQPTSAGAIAGACVALAVLSLIERWLAATRGLFAAQWAQRSLVAKHQPVDSDADPASPVALSSIVRAAPPFVWARDLPRGALFAMHSLVGYLLMLAAMTFQAGYIIAIIFGLSLGEIFFGRFATEDHMH